MASESTLHQLRQLINQQSGLVLPPHRLGDLEIKLAERFQLTRCNSLEEYMDFLATRPEGARELKALVECFTIHETSFFRNPLQFAALKEWALPEILKKKEESSPSSLRIWSAGCSNGCEPYSIAIVCEEMKLFSSINEIFILATDLDQNSLEEARRGIYGPKSVQEIPPTLLQRYFAEKRGEYHLEPRIKQRVHLHFHNLASDLYSYPEMQNLDLILCRNVMIYFDALTRKRVIENLSDCLNPNGYLFVGHSETLWEFSHCFEPVEYQGSFIYRKIAN